MYERQIPKKCTSMVKPRTEGECARNHSHSITRHSIRLRVWNY